MKLQLKSFEPINKESILSLTGSKSETNRLLILQALWPEIRLDNLVDYNAQYQQHLTSS